MLGVPNISIAALQNFKAMAILFVIAAFFIQDHLTKRSIASLSPDSTADTAEQVVTTQTQYLPPSTGAAKHDSLPKVAQKAVKDLVPKSLGLKWALREKGNVTRRMPAQQKWIHTERIHKEIINGVAKLLSGKLLIEDGSRHGQIIPSFVEVMKMGLRDTVSQESGNGVVKGDGVVSQERKEVVSESDGVVFEEATVSYSPEEQKMLVGCGAEKWVGIEKAKAATKCLQDKCKPIHELTKMNPFYMDPCDIERCAMKQEKGEDCTDGCQFPQTSKPDVSTENSLLQIFEERSDEPKETSSDEPKETSSTELKQCIPEPKTPQWMKECFSHLEETMGDLFFCTKFRGNRAECEKNDCEIEESPKFLSQCPDPSLYGVSEIDFLQPEVDCQPKLKAVRSMALKVLGPKFEKLANQEELCGKAFEDEQKCIAVAPSGSSSLSQSYVNATSHPTKLDLSKTAAKPCKWWPKHPKGQQCTLNAEWAKDSTGTSESALAVVASLDTIFLGKVECKGLDTEGCKAKSESGCVWKTHKCDIHSSMSQEVIEELLAVMTSQTGLLKKCRLPQPLINHLMPQMTAALSCLGGSDPTTCDSVKSCKWTEGKTGYHCPAKEGLKCPDDCQTVQRPGSCLYQPNTSPEKEDIAKILCPDAGMTFSEIKQACDKDTMQALKDFCSKGKRGDLCEAPKSTAKSTAKAPKSAAKSKVFEYYAALATVLVGGACWLL